MAWFVLFRKRRVISRLIAQGIPALHRELAPLFRSQGYEAGDRLVVECAVFVLWSIHVGIMNARTSALDRYLANRWLERRAERPERLVEDADCRPIIDVCPIYHRRCMEVLATTRTIYLHEWDGEDLLDIPVRPATATFFCHNVAGVSALFSKAALDELRRDLKESFWSCVKPLDPEIRPAIP
jgi:hypothetical protein